MASFLGCCWFFIAILMFISCGVCYASFFPASFVIGDSLVDSGNNNFIISLSKANYPPNGLDLGRPTGRYTNGRTIPDIIGQELGVKNFAPPYLDPTTTGDAILSGVNYASGGGGILNFTGKIFIGRINLDAQLDNFANTRQDLISSIGIKATLNVLRRSVFSVTMGANDFINNYLVPIAALSERIILTPDEFVESLISRYRVQLTRLYELDARKIIVANVGPIGCIPYLRELFPSGADCVAFPNELARAFNQRLVSVVADLNANLKGAHFVYADVYNIVADIIQNYPNYGFEVEDSACCYVAGKFGGLIPCGPKSKICPDRSKYVFWDPYHPSDATNQVIATRLLDGSPEDIHPVNVRMLAHL